ncbi:MAG: hypothetical protein AB1765_12070 [Candidatus Hydrogenedentota bacterium]
MTTIEIINQLRRLNSDELINIIENAVAVLESKIQSSNKTKNRSKKQLFKAAKKLVSEYKNNSELTAFTLIDGDEFYA